MAVGTYIVKSRDNLTKIADGRCGPDVAAAIPGSSVNAKIDALVALNNIPDRNLIYPGQILYLNEAAKSGASSSSSTTTNTTPPNHVVFNQKLVPLADSESGRNVFASWTWHRIGEKDDKGNLTHQNFKLRWEWDFPDSSQSRGYDIKISESTTTNTWATFEIPEEFRKTVNWVQLFVTPIANNIVDSEGKDTGNPHWTAEEFGDKYNFADNPPMQPDKPTCEINNNVLTMKIDSIKNETNAAYIVFQVVKDNTSTRYTSDAIPVVSVLNTDYGKVSHSHTVELGSNYKVRAKAIATNKKESGWTDFSDEVATKPSAPSMLPDLCRGITRTDKTKAAHLEWTAVPNATSYKIEYTDELYKFDSGEIKTKSTDTTDSPTRTSIDITFSQDELGDVYYFRVRAINDKVKDTNNQTSDPSDPIDITMGSKPEVPTTYSTSESAFAGETTYKYVESVDKDGNPCTITLVDYSPMELNWIHNSSDKSEQSLAELNIKINNNDWFSYIIVNETNSTESGENIVESTFRYGTVVSYKGNLYVKLDTNYSELSNATVQWKIKTAGVSNEFSDWSTPRTIYIYEKPTLELSVTSDLEGAKFVITRSEPADWSTKYKDYYIMENGVYIPVTGDTAPTWTEKTYYESNNMITTLTGFPFYIRGKLSLSDYTIQRPVGYHLWIVSNDYYVTVDDIGRTKIVNPGDRVYSKYFDTSDTLIVEMSANNVDLESGIRYTVYCDADMSTGLTVGNSHEFDVSWVDVEYAINADISINADAYTALITPYCREKIPIIVGEGDDAYTTYEDGELIENVTLSVYRREYDGSYKEIATGIPNNYTSVTDPHPALDYARYRFVAKDTNTGAISYWDMPGYPTKGHAVIIQWDEEWSTFDTGENTFVEGPSWSGSLLKLPYNIKVTDKRKRDVELIEYVGREHPVSYYGTQLSESSQWSVEIPAYDKETIYALRRLSIWSGDVYVREPSGMGYWANVEVSFNKSYDSVKIPISLNITRVEGGV